MKLTEKYYLCDMCSKIVKKENMNSITGVFDGNSGKSYLVQFVNLSRISTLFNHLESGNLLKKDINILHFCPECSDFIRNKNRTNLLCLDNLSVSGMSQELGETIGNFLPQMLERKVNFHESFVSDVMATFIDDSLQKELSFAKAKNNKLAEVYFTPINTQIGEMLKEEKTEE